MACALTYAATQVPIGNFYYELSGTEATLVQHESYKSLTQAFIPASVNYNTHQYTVTKIADNAFYNCPELLAVSIPSSVTYVGEKAFANCTWLDSVAWHPVRMNNTNYATNTFPFYGCSKITRFTFGPGVQRIPAYLCYNLSGITDLRFPDGLEFIAKYAFKGLTQITELVLPESLNSIGAGVFNGCTGLTKINIPAALTSISDYFCYNTALTQITLPATVTYIGEGAFSTTKISTLTVPESVETVGDNAFAFNPNLTSVVWNPVRLTAGYATNTFPFYSCAAITSFTFGPNVQRIPSYLCYRLSGISSLDFPDGLQFIGNNAFCGLTAITEIVLPEGFNSMGTGIFDECTSLAAINIPSTISYIGDYFCYHTALPEITIPANITSIGTYAFSASQISSITIPENVTTIGTCAFASCPNLKTVVWNAKSASCGTSINTIPFYNSKLTSITFGENVSYISPYLCYGQSTLSEIYNYAVTPQTINANVFYNVNRNTCALYVPQEGLSDYQAKEVWKEFTLMTGVLSSLKYEDVAANICYRGNNAEPLHQAPVMLRMPVAPYIPGYRFSKWEVVAGDFADGIILQAVYEKDDATDIENVSQTGEGQGLSRKLIQDGKLYILRDDALFTITGQAVR